MIEGPLTFPPRFWGELLAAYAMPQRHYHTFGHVRDVVQSYQRVPDWNQPDEVFVAILFHDAIYEAGRADNETRSAVLAMSAIQRWQIAVNAARVGELIGLTARHGDIDAADIDVDAAMFLDCDMAILAADWPAFEAYEAGIASEYAPVHGDGYPAGRRAFLEQLLEGSIFLSPGFRDRYESTAKANIRRILRASSPAGSH